MISRAVALLVNPPPPPLILGKSPLLYPPMRNRVALYLRGFTIEIPTKKLSYSYFGIVVSRTGSRHTVCMQNVESATLSQEPECSLPHSFVNESDAADAIMEELRQLRAAISVYQNLVKRLMDLKLQETHRGTC